MKTAKEVIKEGLGDELFDEFNKYMIFPKPNGKFPVIDLLENIVRNYAVEAIKEDRVNVAEKAATTIEAFNDMSDEGSYITVVDKHSIINALYPELK